VIKFRDCDRERRGKEGATPAVGLERMKKMLDDFLNFEEGI